MLYDYTRYAGMQVLFQSILSGGCLLVPEFNDNLQNKIGFLVNLAI